MLIELPAAVNEMLVSEALFAGERVTTCITNYVTILETILTLKSGLFKMRKRLVG